MARYMVNGVASRWGESSASSVATSPSAKGCVQTTEPFGSTWPAAPIMSMAACHSSGGTMEVSAMSDESEL
eukprot:CAMPEP_0175994002 /NCGR_PEP_ID=MMETSP0108-20121206/54307_1 /TAXON_ID=195067 ORGANISM="Goniomonas pacifica, Strain CCMP1869" /NCGR_SAMPLE_ID=MMETSP0108 /ASSEMBLY_ACC=CAM_ASM_000204 /LENGTH=70 /DNA_ID=CAMNT_0017325911 /DNA_START=76 /DNA_END=284 /DNA_ORIENTATION=-